MISDIVNRESGIDTQRDMARQEKANLHVSSFLSCQQTHALALLTFDSGQRLQSRVVETR
jgi:hypothetical protein